jgi:hypothetical protein
MTSHAKQVLLGGEEFYLVDMHKGSGPPHAQPKAIYRDCIQPERPQLRATNTATTAGRAREGHPAALVGGGGLGCGGRLGGLGGGGNAWPLGSPMTLILAAE